MKKLLFAFLFSLLFTFFGTFLVHAETTNTSTLSTSSVDKYFRGTVMTIVRDGSNEVGDSFQDLRVHIDSGDLKGGEKEIRVIDSADQKSRVLGLNDKVIVLQSTDLDGKESFAVMDLYRFPKVMILLAIFFFIILWVVGRRRGLLSLLALGWSVAVLMLFIVPQIAHGANPFLVSVTGAFFIVIVSIALGHGLNRRTIIASVGTLITLVLSVVIAYLSIKFTRSFGMGSEDAQFLLSSPLGEIDLSGVLMAGIIIGTLGVLDDVTTAQAAAVEEIHFANKSLSVRELYKRGMSVGKEHIIALVNTLVLAYAGASLPVLLLLSIYVQPIWVTLSSEMIVEEVVRTLSGSVSLILAVPITTYLAAFVIGSKEK
ncbi:MAG: hypothetical protein A3B90_00920 [Candidatus Magasanikbacteria bacterium RIFCSPHIGHO2_02_FULL_41_13]|uniref:YibE/F family protein n=1 Tax=Candidatus Magasanikbacteria bacterium RIFCSPHIGHO2_02_FULL_41_13 TaxID=1798676 RepID=A0A1F6M4K9_9BACT|nr:MAG: hypothetical protein A3B90_00920 [Candidatus Magasanikbacteria bacterium RIFCSPHIGHO2_02_FULL_41_13]